MDVDLGQERQRAHAHVDPLAPAKLNAVRNLLEIMVDPGSPDVSIEDEEIGGAEVASVARSKA